MVDKFLHLFLPRHSNNHKARLIHPSSLLIVTILLVGLQSLVILTPRYSPLPKVLGYASQISVDQVVSLTNQKRAEKGLGPLTINRSLASAAHLKGEHMLAHNYWAHIAPDGTEPWSFFRNVGYKYRYAGENLARDFSDATSAVNAWMASPTHKDNMLSPNYSEIGVAVVEGDLNGTDTTIIVQLFGKQLATAAKPVATTITNEVPVATGVPEASSQPEENEDIQIVPVAQAQDETVAENEVLASPFEINRGISMAIVSVLVLVFVVDLMIISRKRIIRISSRNFAHIAFLGMILTVLTIAKAGQIL